jgi:hypothetical protein
MKRVHFWDVVKNKRLHSQKRRGLRVKFPLGFVVLLLLVIPLLGVGGCEPKQPAPPVAPAEPEITPTPPVTPAQSGRRKDAGHLAADRLIHDFADVDQNQKLTTSFELKNDGKETLEIGEIIPSCKCVLAPLKSKVLEPGQSVTLQVTFTTSTQPGISIQTIRIHTEPPALPSALVLRLTANVKRYITIVPQHFEIKLSKKKQPDITLKISSTDEKPFRILSYRSSEKSIQLAFDKTKTASTHMIPIKVDRSTLDTSRKGGTITLRLNHPKSQSLAVGYMIIPPIAAHPSTRRIPDAEPGKTVTDSIEIVSNFQESFELGEIKSEEGLVQVKTIEKITNGYKLFIEIKIPKNPAKKFIRDYLNIRIKDDPKNTLKVLFYAILQ